MIAEYSQLMTRKPHVVMKIIRGEDTRRFGEASFKAEEEGCHICGIPGHFWKKCRHYNKKFSLEQNRNYFKRKNGENTNEARAVEPRTSGGTTEARATSGSTGGRAGGSESRSTGGSTNRGRGGHSNSAPPTSDSSTEQARLALELDMSTVEEAKLGAEELSLMCTCGGGMIDLLLDTGTVSNLVPEDQRAVVQDIRNETASLVGVGGARVLASETGVAGVFGKSRIVPGSGAICISQRQFGDKFQMINPHQDLVILRGWPRTKYANREYHFVRDSEDQLLHCRLKATSELAMLARGTGFYRPDEINLEVSPTMGLDKLTEIRRFHEYYSHASINELKRMVLKWFPEGDVSPRDIDHWYSVEGKFCTGCSEGKLKEHARKTSSKPLSANRPGENGVGDLMFVEGRNDIKVPFYIHVDVATKMIIGYAMKNKTYGEVKKAIEFVDDRQTYGS